MTVPTTRTPAVAPAYRCKHCTAPVDTGDTCTFCAQYAPLITLTVPQRLDVLAHRIDLVHRALNGELRGLPSDAPLFAVTDLVVALGHLRAAAVALDKATDALEADAAAVTK